MPVWRKLGQIYSADNVLHPKLRSHAANPLPVHMEGDVYRVFFSSRDDHNRSSVGALDFDIKRRDVLEVYNKPIFEHGPQGSFFADGVSIGNCYRADGQTFMLFMGWQAPENAHWRGDIGKLRVSDDLDLTLCGAEPLLASNDKDPLSLSYPWVLPARGGGYDMWYGSTISWTSGNGEMLHVIKHATSHDGHAWERRGIAVPYSEDIAQAFSRPSVVWNNDGTGQMWFSYRGSKNTPYRIGYARCMDGQTWEVALKDAGIDVSPDGWDSDMIEYPFVLEHQGERYMFYNGNGFGRTGFGLAILT